MKTKRARTYLTDASDRNLLMTRLVGSDTTTHPRLSLLLIVVSIVACTAMHAHADEGEESATGSATASAESWVEQVVRDAIDSVVLITVEGRDGDRASLGSGFVVSGDGLIATNLHVIGEARPITVRFRDGRQFAVTEIYATDRALDLAVVRIDANGLNPLELADDDHPARQGQPIVALGNPMGLRQSAVSGIVSGERDIDGRNMLQIAIPIEQGNSGGPVIDADGHVLGVVTLKSAVTRNLGFATRAEALRNVLASPNRIAMKRWKTMGSLSHDDWSIVFGARWQQRSGQILVSEVGDGFGGRALCLWRGELPQRPFEFGVFVRLDNEDGAAGLVFNADGQDRHYGFYPSAGRLRLTRFDGPTVYSWHILDEFVSPHYQRSGWNHLKVRLEEDVVICFVNDHQVLKRKLAPSGASQIGLAKFRDTHARFRQFAVAATLAPSQLAEERLQPIRRRLKAASLDEDSNDLLNEFALDVAASRQVIDERIKQLRDQTQKLARLETDVHVRATCDELAQLFGQNESKISLSHAALLVSKLDNAELDVMAYQQQFAQMATEIVASLPPDASPADRLSSLNRYLFEDNGFHGSRTNYYHSANSYLDRVMDDREGIPITLSILYMELATRIGLPMEGVGLPGHFVVRYVPADGESQLIDVFNGAKTLNLEDAQALSAGAGGGPLGATFLDASVKREVILRVLRNLQGVAQRNQQPESLQRYLEAMVTLDPNEPSYRGMRAVVRYETGRQRAAIEDLDWFLQNQPEGIDLEAIRELKSRFSAGL